MLSRRGLIIGGGAMAAVSLSGCSEKVTKALGFAQRMVEIQKRHGGRVGVSAITGDKVDEALSIQSTERFAHCSTFKWVLATAVLQQVDQGKLALDKAIPYGKADLLEYAPTTTAHVGDGHMKVVDLCGAAVSLSDNTAANLLLPLVGGPAGLTAFVRGLGDTETRFDRNEPTLNTNLPKDDRDTTTPDAMSHLLKTVFAGTVLKPETLARLKDWMVKTSTGPNRIRAGVPADWVVAHKTGTGENSAINDVGVLWPPAKPPIYLSIYTSGGTLDEAGHDKVIADTTKLVLDTLDFVKSLDK